METAFTTEQFQEVYHALHYVTLEKSIASVLMLLIGVIVLQLTAKLVDKLVGILPLEKTRMRFFAEALKIVLVLILITQVAQQLNIPKTSLVALFGLFTLAVSLSLKDIFANVMNGLVLLMSRPFVASNYVKIGEVEGTVEAISMMYTHLRTRDNKVILLPNKDLSSGQITNYSTMPTRRVDVSITVAYVSQFKAVMEALGNAARRVCDKYNLGKEPKFDIFVNSFKDTGIEYLLLVPVENKDWVGAYFDLHEFILEELKKKGIKYIGEVQRVEMVEGTKA